MSLFDDVIVNVAAAVDEVNKKTTEFVDRSKVRVASAELRSKINAQFETLGRYVYDTTVAGTTDNEVVGKYVSEITALINELKALQEALLKTSGKIICQKCECANSSDSLFCKRCGNTLDFANLYTAKQTVPQPDNVEAAQTSEDVEAADAGEVIPETDNLGEEE